MKHAPLMLCVAIAAACVFTYWNNKASTTELRQQLQQLEARQDSINLAIAQRDIALVRQIDSVYVVINNYAFKRRLNAEQTDSLLRNIDAIEQERLHFLESLLYE